MLTYVYRIIRQRDKQCFLLKFSSVIKESAAIKMLLKEGNGKNKTRVVQYNYRNHWKEQHYKDKLFIKN